MSVASTKLAIFRAGLVTIDNDIAAVEQHLIRLRQQRIGQVAAIHTLEDVVAEEAKIAAAKPDNTADKEPRFEQLPQTPAAPNSEASS